MTRPAETSIERLSPAQIEARLAAASVVWIPLGAIEFHGPHLPVGLDALTAHGICTRAAARAGGVVLPPLHQAVGGEHSRYPWTLMSETPVAIRTLLRETLTRLSDSGVLRAVLVSGHFAREQGDLVDEVVDDWNAAGAGMRAVGRTLGQVPDPPVAPDHAGRFESLLLRALAPELVHLEALPDAARHPAPRDEDPFGPDRHRSDHPLFGVFGPDPRHLDPADAEPLLEHIVAWVAGLAGD